MPKVTQQGSGRAGTRTPVSDLPGQCSGFPRPSAQLIGFFMVFAPRSRLTLAGPAATEPWFGLSQSAMRPWCRGRRKLTLLTPPPGGSESWTGRRIRCATQRTWPGFSPRKCWLSAETESQIPHSLQGLAPMLPRMSKNESSASKAGTPPLPQPHPGRDRGTMAHGLQEKPEHRKTSPGLGLR